ncbi:hypothetical protein DRN94_004005 [archaeon]|nr:hypothetical protein [archaeon]
MTVEAEVVDNNGLGKCSALTVDAVLNGLRQSLSWVGDWRFSARFTVDQGVYNLALTAADRFNNTAQRVFQIVVDWTPPTLFFSRPSDKEVISTRTFWIEGVASDNTGLTRIQLLVNETPVAEREVAGKASESFRFNYTAESDGWYCLSVTVYDRAELSNSSTVTVLVDTLPPFVEILEPGSGTQLSEGNVTIRWRGHDYNGSGISYFQVFLDAELLYEGKNTSLTASIDEPGEHLIIVYAYDRAGHSSSDRVKFEVVAAPPLPHPSAVWMYAVLAGAIVAAAAAALFGAPIFRRRFLDRTPPTIIIHVPKDGDRIYSNEIHVVWEGSDRESGIAHYEVRLDEGRWINVGQSLSFVFTNVPEGKHTVWVRAYDRAGNVAEAHVDINVESLTAATPAPTVEAEIEEYLQRILKEVEKEQKRRKRTR